MFAASGSSIPSPFLNLMIVSTSSPLRFSFPDGRTEEMNLYKELKRASDNESMAPQKQQLLKTTSAYGLIYFWMVVWTMNYQVVPLCLIICYIFLLYLRLNTLHLWSKNIANKSMF